MSQILRAGLALSALFVLLLTAGCDSGPDSTYPAAGTFTPIEVTTLRRATPGTYNVAAFVSRVTPCAPAATCSFDGTIELAASNTVEPPDNAPVVLVDSPSQFVRGDRYLLSVNVVAVSSETARHADDRTDTQILLIGYDPLD